MPQATARPPQLHNGDRMSQGEFLRAWEQIPELKKAELIDGVVYVPSPVSLLHADYSNLMGSWLRLYAVAVGGLRALSDATWLMGGSSPQPDGALVRAVEPASQTYASILPELLLEVAYSSRSYDLGPKQELYRRSRVPEYLCLLLDEERVEWRALQGTAYRLLYPDGEGVLRSIRCPGLWLDTQALFPPDERRLFATLDRGIASRHPA